MHDGLQWLSQHPLFFFLKWFQSEEVQVYLVNPQPANTITTSAVRYTCSVNRLRPSELAPTI